MGEKGVFLDESALLQALPGLDGACTKLYIYIKYLAEKNGGGTSCKELGSFLSMDINNVSDTVRELARQGLVRLGAQGQLTLCSQSGAAASLPEEPPSYQPGGRGLY